MPEFASVAIPNVPKDKLSYAIPEGLRERLAPGMRVVVPLGKRYVTGYVIAADDEEPAFAVKPLHEVLDARPVFSPSMIQLCEWIARYYACSLGDAMKAALPQGIDVQSERFVSLATDDEARLESAIGRSATKRRIVEALSTGELISEDVLCREIGLKSIAPQLRELLSEGVISYESVLERPLARRKTISVVRLLPSWTSAERIFEVMALLEKRAPKQVNILAVLWRTFKQGEPTIPMTDLLRHAKASSQQIRALVEKELIEVLEEEVIRELRVGYEEAVKEFELTTDQRAALQRVTQEIDANVFGTILLHGVTASGKTKVYIDAIHHALAQGKTAIVLVPEISLTPQLVSRFRTAFEKDVTVLHSRMSVGERYDSWRQTLEGRYRIVVGVRSAVFAPLANVGLIVVDEEHEATYKQSDAIPRYHARDTAVMRGFIEGATVLLGSATPSAESYSNAMNGKYKLIEMPIRIDDVPLPTIIPVDMAQARKQRRGHGNYSLELLDAIRYRVARGEGSIILQNRRGYAPHFECMDCGHVEECTNCSISMVYHKDRNMLRCHYCGATRRTPVVCPRCGGAELDLIGAGTQRIEEELRQAIPEARILRMDFDSTRRKGAHDLILTSFAAGEADVLVGTQMVAKGLDFDRVTLVGVISAEQSLLLPDFRSGERTFQILTQVSGRAGRGKSKGEVFLQAMRPEHHVLQRVMHHDYPGFIANELRTRRNLAYPPFTRLVLLTFSGANDESVSRAATLYRRELERLASFYRVHPPQPAIVRRINKRYRWHMLIRVTKEHDPHGARMAETLRIAHGEYLSKSKTKSVRIDIDVDPQGMM